MAIKLKSGYADVVIGYNNSSLPMGKRTDYEVLYRNAKATGYKPHLDMFEVIPDGVKNEMPTEQTIKQGSIPKQVDTK